MDSENNLTEQEPNLLRSYSSSDILDRGRMSLDDDSAAKRKTKGKLILKSFKKQKIKALMNQKIMDILATKDFSDNDLKAIFNGDTVIKNIKTRRKELKTNDTIVAIISLIMIILGFYQVSVCVTFSFMCL
jgi:hypothetical protein